MADEHRERSNQSGDKLRGMRSAELAEAPGQKTGLWRALLWLFLVVAIGACVFGFMQYASLHTGQTDKPVALEKDVEGYILRSSRYPNLVADLTTPKAKAPAPVAVDTTATSTATDSTENSGGLSGGLNSSKRKKPPEEPKTPEQALGSLSGLSEAKTEQALLDAIAKQPQMMPARVQLIQMYANKQDFEKARKLCQEGLQVSTMSGDKETFRILLGELHASPGG